MFIFKTFLGLVLLVTVKARYVGLEDQETLGVAEKRSSNYGDENPNLKIESFDPAHLVSARVRRQAQGSFSLNSDGGLGFGAKLPIAGNDKNILSAMGSIDLNNKLQSASQGIGLALDNINGHSLSVMKETVPGFGEKLIGAGKVNLFHNANHDVSARAFVTKNMPNFPNMPNSDTIGGGVEYMYNNKVGASLGMASTPFINRKDYSAMGDLNVFHSPTSSVDFNAGFKKYETPFTKSNWGPNFGLTFSKTFGGL